ncbi:MAG: BTAD domain-containing putative transcriptional regulator, partial [Acidimicrobiia bacterium]
MLEILVLGPIRARRDGESLDLGGPTQRRLLATLVARHDEVVSVAELLEALWGEDPPPSGSGSLQAYVSRLRRALGPDAIETAAPGYRYNGNVAATDSIRLAAAAQELPKEPDSRVEAINQALQSWVGPPFEDFDHLQGAARALTEIRIGLEEQLAKDLERLNRVPEAIGILERVVTLEPLRETTWIQLAELLAASGRKGESIRAMARYRDRVAAVGLEPSGIFEEAETRIFEFEQPLAAMLISPTTSFVGRLE